MTDLFGDNVAMVLVGLGAMLTAVLIWFLIRKYRRDHPRLPATPTKIATPPTSATPDISAHRPSPPAPQAETNAEGAVPNKPPSGNGTVDKAPAAKAAEADAKRRSGGASKHRKGSLDSSKASTATERPTRDTRKHKAKKGGKTAISPVDSGIIRRSKKKQLKPASPPKEALPTNAASDTSTTAAASSQAADGSGASPPWHDAAPGAEPRSSEAKAVAEQVVVAPSDAADRQVEENIREARAVAERRLSPSDAADRQVEENIREARAVAERRLSQVSLVPANPASHSIVSVGPSPILSSGTRESGGRKKKHKKGSSAEAPPVNPEAAVTPSDGPGSADMDEQIMQELRAMHQRRASRISMRSASSKRRAADGAKGSTDFSEKHSSSTSSGTSKSKKKRKSKTDIISGPPSRH